MAEAGHPDGGDEPDMASSHQEQVHLPSMAAAGRRHRPILEPGEDTGDRATPARRATTVEMG